MPVITIYGAPSEFGRSDLEQVRRNIVAAVLSIAELGLHFEQQVTVFFPEDRLAVGGQKDFVAVTILYFARPERTPDVIAKLTAGVGQVIVEAFKGRFVECFPEAQNPAVGFWTNKPS